MPPKRLDEVRAAAVTSASIKHAGMIDFSLYRDFAPADKSFSVEPHEDRPRQRGSRVIPLKAETIRTYLVYATVGEHCAFVHSFTDLEQSRRLCRQLNRRYAHLGLLAVSKIEPSETQGSWSQLRDALIGGTLDPEIKSWSIEVRGRNTKWLKRLHNAGLAYNPSSQTWHRGALTQAQAKSLAGRMRDVGVIVNIVSANFQPSSDKPYQPTPYDQAAAAREENARRPISRSKGSKSRRKRRQLEPATAGQHQQTSTP